MPRLLITRGTSFRKEYTFAAADMITIGRTRSNDIWLPDPSRKVSRYHAAIVRCRGEDNRYFLRDLSSLRSSRLDGEVVDARLLKDGDLIEIADYELTYLERSSSLGAVRHLRVVDKKPTRDSGHHSTVLFSHHEILKEIHLSSEQREVVEELLRVSRTAPSMRQLMSLLISPLVHALGADRGFVALFREDASGEYEEAGSAGLSDSEQIEITDAKYLERLVDGKCSCNGCTILAPIMLREQAQGFFCLDSATHPFGEDDANFLIAFGRMATAKLLGSSGRTDRSSPSFERLAWPTELVGRSVPMRDLRDQIVEAAASDLNVLVLGETGTGKELVAQAIHATSSQPTGPLIAVNCAAITENLAEAELFGIAPNSGVANADPKGCPGRFELADGGTLFLDEIQALSLPLQEKLLRVLEDRMVWRIGARQPKAVAVRIIAATDQKLEGLVGAGRFTGALYHRFGMRLQLRPLRERPEDIPLLAYYFLDTYSQNLDSVCHHISHRALQKLLNYQWPGNVRELENEMQAAVAKGRPVVFSWDLKLAGATPARMAGEGNVARRPTEGVHTMEEVERQKIQEALEATRGNITRTAELLGKSRMTIINKMEKFGIPRDYGDPKGNW